MHSAHRWDATGWESFTRMLWNDEILQRVFKISTVQQSGLFVFA